MGQDYGEGVDVGHLASEDRKAIRQAGLRPGHWLVPAEQLKRYADPSQPLITYYDTPANRVELSVSTAGNAVAKASSMLRDGLAVGPGAHFSLDLPRHWQLPVWVWAALSVGAHVGRDLAGQVAVRMIGPSGLAEGAAQPASGATDVLASSCDAYGMPVAGGVPSGVIDIALEVRGYPDTFTAEPDASGAAALLVDGTWWPYQKLAPRPTMAPGARLWLDASTDDAELLSLLVEPLFVHGSIVLATGTDEQQSAVLRGVESAAIPT